MDGPQSRADWIVDRGCFHGIPEPLCAGYVANVAAWAKDDARLLLFCRIQRAHAVPALFGPWFEIVRTDDESYERSAGPLPRTVAPGKVFRMIRRGRTRAAPAARVSAET